MTGFEPLALLLWMASLPAGPTLFTILAVLLAVRFVRRRAGI